jgi:hypothetical protein
LGDAAVSLRPETVVFREEGREVAILAAAPRAQGAINRALKHGSVTARIVARFSDEPGNERRVKDSTTIR